MKWQHVQDNWPAFYEAILDRWPKAAEGALDDVDGDQTAFVDYIASLGAQSKSDARDEILEWLQGELPSDVVMDPLHDNKSMMLSEKFIPEGEDEYDDDARFGDDT